MLRCVPGDLGRRMATLASSQVKHDPNNKLFYVTLPQAANQASPRAVLEYATLKGGALDLYHTEVPRALRGQGIAGLLVKAAFDHCVTNKLKMKLTCTYVLKYYNDNKLPQYTEQVID